MKDQHEKIKGYRDLDEREIDLINKIKSHAELTAELVEEIEALRQYQEDQIIEAEIDLTTEGVNIDQINESFRCLENAKTQLQTGNMWLVRSVALPYSF